MIAKVKLLIIIPAYNEAENIPQVVSNLVHNFPEYDFVVVNDGSSDDTAKICYANSWPVIDLPVDLGLAAGVRAGMKYAKAHDYALQFDGDGQHNPEYIESMLDTIIRDHADIVIGSRFVSGRKPNTLRMLGSNLIQFALFMACRKKISDPTSGMRMYNKRLIAVMANFHDFGPEPDTMAHFIRSGIFLKEVSVKMNERTSGKSYLNTARAIHYMIRIFSTNDITIFQNKYDVVCMFDVLEHIEDWKKMLDKIMIIADKYIILSFPTGRMRPYEKHIGHYRNFVRGEVESYIEIMGGAWKLMERYNAGFPFYSPIVRDLTNLFFKSYSEITYQKMSMIAQIRHYI